MAIAVKKVDLGSRKVGMGVVLRAAAGAIHEHREVGRLRERLLALHESQLRRGAGLWPDIKLAIAIAKLSSYEVALLAVEELVKFNGLSTSSEIMPKLEAIAAELEPEQQRPFYTHVLSILVRKAESSFGNPSLSNVRERERQRRIFIECLGAIRIKLGIEGQEGGIKLAAGVMAGWLKKDEHFRIDPAGPRVVWEATEFAIWLAGNELKTGRDREIFVAELIRGVTERRGHSTEKMEIEDAVWGGTIAAGAAEQLGIFEDLARAKSVPDEGYNRLVLESRAVKFASEVAAALYPINKGITRHVRDELVVRRARFFASFAEGLAGYFYRKRLSGPMAILAGTFDAVQAEARRDAREQQNRFLEGILTEMFGAALSADAEQARLLFLEGYYEGMELSFDEWVDSIVFLAKRGGVNRTQLSRLVTKGTFPLVLKGKKEEANNFLVLFSKEVINRGAFDFTANSLPEIAGFIDALIKDKTDQTIPLDRKQYLNLAARMAVEIRLGGKPLSNAQIEEWGELIYNSLRTLRRGIGNQRKPLVPHLAARPRRQILKLAIDRVRADLADQAFLRTLLS